MIKTIVQSEQPVRFHGFSTVGTGLITKSDRSAMAITLIETDERSCFSLFEHITGYFDFHGTTYAFESTVRDNQKQKLTIDPPDKLLRSLQRQYVRVRRPKDIKVTFRLANEEIHLEYPVCPEYVSVEETEPDSSFSGKNLNDLMGNFKKHIELLSSINTIVMFRTHKPELFEEKLISGTGKVLFIPSTASLLPKTDPYPEGRIITETIEEKFEAPDYFVTGSRFEKLLLSKKRQGITSEIWCPIVYFQYVVGYIYLSNSTREAFDISMVDYVWDFSRILAWELKKTGYFQGEAQTRKAVEHSARIIDMSPGGMLISLPDSEIRTPIREGSIFSVDISLEKKTVSCSAKVCRRYSEKMTVSYGTTFINLSSKDMMILYEFLYRKPFTENDPLAYEQQKKKFTQPV